MKREGRGWRITTKIKDNSGYKLNTSETSLDVNIFKTNTGIFLDLSANEQKNPEETQILIVFSALYPKLKCETFLFWHKKTLKKKKKPG